MSNISYKATRLNQGRPIIDQQSFSRIHARFACLGENINGPSVIRVPDWIKPEDRAHPEARYYLYFGDHRGSFIRLAWATKVGGPYHLYGIHDEEDGPRGVLDLGPSREISFSNGLSIRDHIASPDVHVDHERRRVELYFHGPTYYADQRIEQKTFVSWSDDGLSFRENILPISLGWAYFRVFKSQGRLHAIAARGALYQAPQEPFSIPDGFDPREELWQLQGESYTDNPFQRQIDADASSPERLRHSAVLQHEGRIYVFYSRVGDQPERIQLATLHRQADKWQPSYPPVDILRPEMEWEGATLPIGASAGGPSVGVHELRDPAVFTDLDGRTYLFYSGEGEAAIGVAELLSTT